MTDEPDIQIFYSWEEMELLKSRIAELEAEVKHLRETLTGRPSKELYEAHIKELEVENGQLREALKEIAATVRTWFYI